MRYGQNRGSEKTLIKEKGNLNENREKIYKFCGNFGKYAICIIDLGDGRP